MDRLFSSRISFIGRDFTRVASYAVCGEKAGFASLNIIYRLVHYITPPNVVQPYHIDMANQISLILMYIIYHIFKEFVDRP